jgi:predicted regulator of Ras-like GTPase activity (Roadblock/LC7/MglB family)
MIEKVKKMMEELSAEMPGILAAAVVTVDDGLSIADFSKKEGTDTAAASAYLASIVKSNSKAINLLADDEVTDDILITTNHYHFIIRHNPSLPFFIFFMTTKGEWLGKARHIVKKFDDELATFAQQLTDQFQQAES